MPNGPKGEKRPAGVIGNAVKRRESKQCLRSGERRSQGRPRKNGGKPRALDG
jgi:hypothetical protein